LHDDVQLAGGELPNHLLYSSAGNDPRKSNPESDGKPNLHGNLLVDTTRMPDELRTALPIAVNGNQPASS
jgi:hypothetical protein